MVLAMTCAVCELCDGSDVGRRLEPDASRASAHPKATKTATTPEMKTPELFPVETERVDCRKRRHPRWCRKINYATDGEKKGTLVLVHRSDVEGNVHWCSPNASGRYYYVGPEDGAGYFPEEIVAKNNAVAMSLHPRDTGGSADGRFFVVPEGTDTSGWQTFKDCPWDGRSAQKPKAKKPGKPKQRRVSPSRANPEPAAEDAEFEPVAADAELKGIPFKESQPRSAVPRPAASQQTCCKYCSKGKPCGNTCIAVGKTCRKGPGCAC